MDGEAWQEKRHKNRRMIDVSGMVSYSFVVTEHVILLYPVVS
jgi:hypothetical protein